MNEHINFLTSRLVVTSCRTPANVGADLLQTTSLISIDDLNRKKIQSFSDNSMQMSRKNSKKLYECSVDLLKILLYVQEMIMSRMVHTDGIDNWYVLYTTRVIIYSSRTFCE